MKSGTAWQKVPESSSSWGSGLSDAPGRSLIKHPTTSWPPTHGPRATQPAADEEADAPTFQRRAPRVERQTPTVPWFYLISTILVVAVMIMLVVKQRAELVRENNKLVDLRGQRLKVLKERSELKLSIQRLTALERVDGMVRKDLKMVRPQHRVVLDLSQYKLGGAASVAHQPKAEEATP